MDRLKTEWNQVWIPEIKKALTEFKNPKTRYRQIPNMLTASRLLSPFVIIPVALCGNVIATFIVASLFALTDAFDGKIARKYQLQSKLGSLLDPITDKFFALGLLLPNILSFPLVTSLFLLFESVIAIINTHSKLKGNEPKSNILGKIKTTFLSMSSIAMYLAHIPKIQSLLPILSGITLGLQVTSAVTYKTVDYKKDKKKEASIIISKLSIEASEEIEPTVSLKEQLLKEKEQLLGKESPQKPIQFTKKWK